ncbi:mechanosensitive ion channel protein MscL [Paenibacillus hodogayensis]|uniref:Mechanosensitive ion channel protein MscL n=1 Tax=Paenibacillus hodogayensis TaxID=279208 RepID=A0ABV5W6Q8_9BACL
MIVLDIVWNGQVQETLRPTNQNRRELYWFIVDRLPALTQKYGPDITVSRRTVQE